MKRRMELRQREERLGWAGWKQAEEPLAVLLAGLTAWCRAPKQYERQTGGREGTAFPTGHFPLTFGMYGGGFGRKTHHEGLSISDFC